MGQAITIQRHTNI